MLNKTAEGGKSYLGRKKIETNNDDKKKSENMNII